MTTPILNSLKDLAPLIVQVCCTTNSSPSELELRLRDKLNAEFGDTKQSVEMLDNLHAALQKVLR